MDFGIDESRSEFDSFIATCKVFKERIVLLHEKCLCTQRPWFRGDKDSLRLLGTLLDRVMLRRSKKQSHVVDGTPLLPLPAKHTRLQRGFHDFCGTAFHFGHLIMIIYTCYSALAQRS